MEALDVFSNIKMKKFLTVSIVIIGARCVVANDIPETVLGAGNPGRIIRYL
jgi:serine acetyltransferase